MIITQNFRALDFTKRWSFVEQKCISVLRIDALLFQGLPLNRAWESTVGGNRFRTSKFELLPKISTINHADSSFHWRSSHWRSSFHQRYSSFCIVSQEIKVTYILSKVNELWLFPFKELSLVAQDVSVISNDVLVCAENNSESKHIVNAKSVPVLSWRCTRMN